MHDSRDPPRAWLAGVLFVALAARLAAGVWWQSRLADDFYFGDSQSYWVLARAIARGDSYQFGSPDAKVFRTPGYPLALAPLFVIFGDEPPILAARAWGAVLGTMAVAAVYGLGRQLWDARVGLAAALVAAIYPGAIAMSIFVLSEALFSPLMLVQLLLWIAAVRAVRSTRALAWGLSAGMAAGLATLARPSWLAFVPLAAIVVLAFSRERRRHLLVGSVMMLGFVLVMLPWWIRNAQVTGRFVPTSLQMGISLYDGWNPRADGSSDLSLATQIISVERKRLVAEDDPDVFEYRLDRRFRELATSWATTHPAEVLSLAGTKLLRLWNVWPNEPAFRALPFRAAVFASFVPVMLLAIIGTWRFRELGWPLLLCWLPALYITLLHIVFVSSLRYREPVMLPLLSIAAACLLRWQANPSTLVPGYPAQDANRL